MWSVTCKKSVCSRKVEVFSNMDERLIGCIVKTAS
jgi:hypothetical protein